MVLLSIDGTAMDQAPKKSGARTGNIFTVLVVVVLGALLYSLSTAAISVHHDKCRITNSIANCRQIILAMRLYAADEGGIYPDVKVPEAKDSNTVFRQLIIAGALEDEKIFGAPPCSPFAPDGVLGSAPNYAQAIEVNENHWAMNKGLSDSSLPGIPLIFENPLESTWPPTWNVDDSELPAKGKAKSGGKVIIGTNDTSVELMKLTSTKGAKLPLKPREGREIFELSTEGKDAPKCEILDIAWDKSALDARQKRDSIQKLSLSIGVAITAIVVALFVGRSLLKKRRNRAAPAQP